MNSTKVILDIAPLGDIVMASPIAKTFGNQGCTTALRVPKFALGLANLLGVPVIGPDEEAKVALVLKMGNYLNYDVHGAPLPDLYFRSPLDIPRERKEGGVFAHLTQWMGVHAANLMGIDAFPVNPGDVKISLTEAQIQEGQQLLRGQIPGEKPVVVISAAAGSQNRFLTPTVINATIALLKDDFDVALLAPEPTLPGYKEIDIPRVACSLVQLPAMLVAASAVVSTDSGPFHIAAATIQGLEGQVDPRRLILVAGSSNPLALVYRGNQYVEAPKDVCPVMPCGRHGYGEGAPERLLGHDLYVVNNSACIFEEYVETGLPPCMKAVSAEEIAMKVHEAVQ